MKTITLGRLSAALFALFFVLPVFAFAQTSPSASIQSLSPGTTVSVGNEVSFTVIPSGFSGAVSYSVSDSLSGGTVSSSDINSSGVFVWIPTGNDGGTHNLTITINDQSGNSATVTQQLIVPSAGAVSIQSLSPGTTVNVGQTIFFNAPGTGFTNPVYSVSDSASNSSLTSGAINSTGGFSWTPSAQDVGSHTLTVNVTDSLGDHASAAQSITVNGAPTVSVQSIVPGTTVAPGQPLTFTVVPTGFTNPVYSITDSFNGSSVGNGNVNSSNGSFSWTPNTSDAGTHTITIQISDSAGDRASITEQITVQNGSIVIQSLSPGTSVNVGTPVTFTISPLGFFTPAYTVSDSFSGSTLVNADINSSGAFSWTPSAQDVGVHSITVYASDSYGHTATTNLSITVSAVGSTSVTTTSTTLSALQAQLQALELQIATLGGGSTTSSATAPAYVFSAYLLPGSTGDDVTALQNILAQQGFFSGTATGYYGTVTENAVIAFQAAHGLDQLGVVGPATRAILNSLPSGTTSASASSSTGDGYVFQNLISYGDTSTDVTELQQRLTALGDYSGPVTGYFGDQTQAAVEQFQGAHSIEQVGYVGPSTRAALNQ